MRRILHFLQTASHPEDLFGLRWKPVKPFFFGNVPTQTMELEFSKGQKKEQVDNENTT